MRRVTIWATASFALGFTTLIGAQAAHASWSSNNCDMSPTGESVAAINRSTARTYALSADGDGYEWGGGCWNSNGRDDTPGAPDSEGEGADCSGFVFKTWKLSTDMNATGFKGWSMGEFIHGPYTAASLRDQVGAPVVDLAKSLTATTSMDAFASGTHTGMIYAESPTGQDTIIEAKGDDAGSGIFTRTYRNDTSYDAAGRTGWATGCAGCG